MGNRGLLHNASRIIVRPYAVRRWITCLLSYKNRRRPVMAPGRYTELFFLDEAVSLAAGHRPCAECRRERYRAFQEAWQASHQQLSKAATADDIDHLLHASRITAQKEKITYTARLGELPPGSFVRIGAQAYLVWKAKLLEWTPAGYTRQHAIVQDRTVVVLTPQPLVRCLANGFTVEVHASAGVRD